jgi:membrane associated rhomboid family serine protease
LPENHNCHALHDWDDPDGVWDDDSGGVFDSGFDDSVATDPSGSRGLLDRLGIDTGPGGPLASVRGTRSSTFLTNDTWAAIFTLQPSHPLYVWTWVTSVFSHGGFYHIIGNSIVIFFFGRLLEDYVGTRDFTLLFLASGILAGLGQIGIMIAQGTTAGGVLGASGAGLAIMGTLTVLNPGLKVYLYFILPIPIWVITGLYAIVSVMGILGPVGGGIANGAHLIGLGIGLWYGQRVKSRISLPRQFQFGGGGPGGPGGGRRRF